MPLRKPERPLCAVAPGRAFLLVSLLLAFSPIALFPYDVRPGSSVMPDTVRVGSLLTNRILLEFSGGETELAAIECRYPADPGHYGLQFRNLLYADRLELRGDAWIRTIRLDYVLLAGFAGRLGVAPLEITLFGPQDGQTNLVRTERLFVVVENAAATPLLLFLLPVLAGLFAVLFLVFRSRRRSAAEKTAMEDPGVVS